MSDFTSYRQQRILITGGGGFIASCLAKRLNQLGSDVHLILKPETSDWRLSPEPGDSIIHRGNCRSRENLERILVKVKPDLIYHMAAPRLQGANKPEKLVQDNVTMAGNLVGLLPGHGNPPLVLSGSSLEYGPKTTAHQEEDPLVPLTWHGLGKAFAFKFFQQAARESGIRFSTLRFFHVYGPWESPHRLLGSAIRAALSGISLPMTEGLIRRDWVYVDDVVDACLLAGVSEFKGEAFNIGSGQQYTNEFIVEAVESLCERQIQRISGGFPPSASDSPDRLADISKARRILGWYPKISLEAGINATIEWGKRYPDLLFNNTGYRPGHA